MVTHSRKAGKRSTSVAENEAQKLIEKGMPSQLAYAVANGIIGFNEALKRMADNDRVARIATRHDLSRSVAKQIVLGQLDLESVLFKKRFKAYKSNDFNRSILEVAQQTGQLVVLGLHGGRQQKVTVTSVGDFDVAVVEQSGESFTLKKLSIKYAYWASDWKISGKAFKRSRGEKANNVLPIEKPQDRYRCSDRRLFLLLDREQRVQLDLLEGEQVEGTVSWVSRYELGLLVKGNAEIVVFRHALSRVGAES